MYGSPSLAIPAPIATPIREGGLYPICRTPFFNPPPDPGGDQVSRKQLNLNFVCYKWVGTLTTVYAIELGETQKPANWENWEKLGTRPRNVDTGSTHSLQAFPRKP